MTNDDMVRFQAIQSWVNYAQSGRTTPPVAAEAIEGLAARIRAD